MIQQLDKYKLGLIIALTVLLHVGIMLAFPQVFNFDQTGSIHGSIAFDQYATNLNGTGVYGQVRGIPDARIPPLYSYALALVYTVFGRGFIQVALFHIALHIASLVLLYDITQRLFAGVQVHGVDCAEYIAAFAALSMAVYPYLIFQNLTLIDTPFFITLLHLFIWLMVRLRERPSLGATTWGFAISGGIALGLSILARPIMPPLAILVALWFLFRLNLKQTILRLLPVAVVGVLVVVPWIMRNYAVFNAFVPMTTTSGANFWQGNSPYTIPVFEAGYDVQWTAPDVEAGRYSREADAERFEQAFVFLRENPEVLPELLWTKFRVHWSIDIAPRYNPRENEQFALDDDGELLIVRGDESISGWVAHATYDDALFDVIGRWVHRLYFGTLLLLAIAGTVLSAKHWRDASLLWFVQISMTVVYVFFHPSTRYRVPSDPLLFVLSAYALVWLGTWLLSRRDNHHAV